MPAYSTDKGFTGSAKDKKQGGLGNNGGSDQYGANGVDTTGNYAGAVAKKKADAAAEAAKALTGGNNNTGSLPPGLNPLKYTKNKTSTKPATPGNITKAVVKTVGNLLTGGALGMIGEVAGSQEVTGQEDVTGLGLGYEGPTGQTTGADYDKAEASPAAAGVTDSKGIVPPVPIKKKKNTPLSNVGTLLSGSGGTLVAS